MNSASPPGILLECTPVQKFLSKFRQEFFKKFSLGFFQEFRQGLSQNIVHVFIQKFLKQLFQEFFFRSSLRYCSRIFLRRFFSADNPEIQAGILQDTSAAVSSKIHSKFLSGISLGIPFAI